MKEMTQVGRWIFIGLLAIAVAIGISTFVGDRNWNDGPGNGHARSEVVTTADGQTIVKPDGRRFPPGDWDGLPSQVVCTGIQSDKVLDLIRTTLLHA